MSTTRRSVRNHRPLASSHRVNAEVRSVTQNGREYLVFPIIALREMVIDYPENGTRELLPRDSLQETVDLWAGTPLTFVHPENEDKSADHPNSYTGEVIGQVFEPEIVDEEKLRVQAWLDVEKARDIGGLAEDVVERLEAGEQLATSAGYATYNDDFSSGTHNGENYNLSQGTILPDHVAVFPGDEFKARCDWEDGCGAPRANAVEADVDMDTSDTDVQVNEAPADSDDVFDEPTPALERAQELGCSTVHYHEQPDGSIVFMPCQSMKEYRRVTGQSEGDATYNYETGEYVSLPGGTEPYGRVMEVVEEGSRRCGSRVLQCNAESDETIVVLAVEDEDRPIAHYASSLEPWSIDNPEREHVNGNDTTDGAQRRNLRERQYVQWSWGGGTGYGQVIERVTEPGTCRSVSGNERCASEDRNVLVIGHMSEDGEDQSQRVVKYEDNVDPWDAPSTADSLNYDFDDEAVINHTLNATPLSEPTKRRLSMVTNVEVNGEDIDLTPPDDVQEVAQDFLDAHDEGLIPDGCGTADTSSTGYERAEQLASGDELSVEDIMAAGSGMFGWFERHGAQGNGEVDMREKPDDMSEREFKYQSCGYAAWRAWGGDPAWDWVREKHDAIVSARENALKDDPTSMFEWVKNALGFGTTASESVDDGAAPEPDAGDDAPDGAEAETTNESDSDNMTDDTDNDSDTSDTRVNATLELQEIADHTIFTVEMLEGMDDSMIETIEAQLLKELAGTEANAGHASDEKDKEMTDTNTEEQPVTENTEDEDSESYVTEDELDERLNALEESITETVEDAIESQRTNHEREEKARRVANAIDGMSVEAAQELPDDELDSLAETHANRSNYAGVPGEVDRSPDMGADDEDLDDIPAGGRRNYEKRKSGGD